MFCLCSHFESRPKKKGNTKKTAKRKTKTVHNKSGDPTEIHPQPRRALTLDVAKYQQMLDAPELTDEQREEFLRYIWGIVVAFVGIGFEVREAGGCGQDEHSAALSDFSESDLLELTKPDLRQPFEQSVCADTSGKE